MKGSQKDGDCKATSTSRVAYSAPKLKEFGSVGVLTQAGSMGSSESSPNGPMTMG